MMLQCPLCNLALRPHVESEVEIDICDSCNGVWLDYGELETISNGRDFTPHGEASADLAKLRCPRCDTQRFSIFHLEEGPLAQCTDCRGVFVEGQTMEKAVSLTPPRSDGPRGTVDRRRFFDGILLADLITALLAGLFS